MSSTDIDAIVSDYFRRLEAALSGLPEGDRQTILSDIRAHVNEARAQLGEESERGIRELLDRVGLPEDIAAAAAAGDGERPRRRPGRRTLITAAAVVVVAVLASVLGLLLSGSSGAVPHVRTAPAVPVGAFPTGVDLDAASGTVYVSSGVESELSLIDAATCNASDSQGCSALHTAATGGEDAIGVAVDEQTRTVYAVNGSSGTVAVFDARTCNASDTHGCSKPIALVTVGIEPEFLALNEQTNTIYVANTNSGTVSVIDGTTCDASDTGGCAKTPATVTVGQGAFPIAVDEKTNTVYVGSFEGAGLGGGGTVDVIDGSRCDSATSAGCHIAASLALGGAPSGIAVDPTTDTVYVSSENGTVSVIDGGSCNGGDTTGCAKKPALVSIGIDPRGDAFDASSNTLYVTNAGSNTVSLIDTSTCNAHATSGCSRTPPAVPVGASPRRLVLDPANSTAYVVDTQGSTVSLLDTRYCNASDTRGCPTVASAAAAGLGGISGLTRVGGSGSVVGSSGLSGLGVARYDSTCSPVTSASASGGPASALTARGTEVASGTIDGQSWSLWSADGHSGAEGLEDGGIVLGGKAYGLCNGAPNPLEFELLDTGKDGIVYGVSGYPGKSSISVNAAATKLVTTGFGTFNSVVPGASLPTPSVYAANGVSFFIGALPKSACDYPELVVQATAQGGESAQHHLGFGSCTPDRLLPYTSGGGSWSGGSLSSSAGALALPGYDSTCSPVTLAASSGGPAASLTAGATEVSSGTIDGHTWSLWSAKGQSGAEGLENGGLVVDGRAYGLCPGYANPAELELLDANGTTIDYGVIGYPGAAKIVLSRGTTGTFTRGKALPTPIVQVVHGVSFFIGTLPGSACSYSALELDSTSAGKVSAEHNLGFGGCTRNKLDPITFSQGIWQLAPGHFVNNFGSGGGVIVGPSSSSGTAASRLRAMLAGLGSMKVAGSGHWGKTTWTLEVSAPGADMLCQRITVGGSPAGASCGSATPGPFGGGFGSMGLDSGMNIAQPVLHGVVVASARQVVVTLANHRQVRVQTLPAPRGVSTGYAFFVVPVPCGSSLTSITGLSSSGKTVATFLGADHPFMARATRC